MRASLRRLGAHLAVASAYLGIALVCLRPLAAHLTRTIPRGEQNDVLLHGWILNWSARQILRAPWDLFDANVFFPYRDGLAYTEHFLPEALPVAPVWALTGDPIVTYNVAYLLTFVLGGWGTFLLVRRLTGDPWAAFVAGAFCCYFPAKRWNLAHINTIAVHGVPFAMLALHRLLAAPGLLRALTAGILVALAALASAYYTIYLPLLLLLAVPLLWRAEGHRPTAARAAGVAAAALITAAIVVPVLWPYTATWAGDEPAHSYELQVAGAVDVGEFLILDSVLWRDLLVPDDLDPLTSPFFPGVLAAGLALTALFGADRGSRSSPARRSPGGDPARPPVPAWRRPLRVGGWMACGLSLLILVRHLVAHHRATLGFRDGPELPWTGVLLPAVAGIVVLAAAERGALGSALRGVVARWRASSPVARAYTGTFVASVVIALGPRLKFFGYEGPPLPYAWIYEWVPAASSLRAPFRAAILGQAFLAVVIGFGAARILRRLRETGSARTVASVALAMVAVLVIESAGRALPLEPLPEPASDVYAWLAHEPGDFGILDWPIPDSLSASAVGQWHSTRHWKRRVTGHNGRLPEDIHRLFELSFEPLSDGFMEALRDRFPVRYVIVHLHDFDAETRRWLDTEGRAVLERWWEPVRDVGEDRVYRVRNGGTAGRLDRRFADWMVRGRLRVDLAEPVPPDAGDWRLAVTLLEAEGSDTAGTLLGQTALLPGQRTVALDIGTPDLPRSPVWIRLQLLTPLGQTHPIARIAFETPEGVVYP